MRRQLHFSHLAKYVAIGMLGTLVDFGAYAILVLVALHPVAATSVGSALGMTFNYFVNARWNFRASITLRQAMSFFAIGVSGLVLGAAIVQVLLLSGAGVWIAKIGALMVVVPAQFLANRSWTFGAHH